MVVKCRAWEGTFTPCGWSPVSRQPGLEKAFLLPPGKAVQGQSRAWHGGRAAGRELLLPRTPGWMDAALPLLDVFFFFFPVPLWS